MKSLHFVTLVLSLGGCIASGPALLPSYEITSPFDAAQAERQMEDGLNSIKGNAFMRQQGGGVVTCAGQTVRLVPATHYAKQRFFALFGTFEGGVNRERKNFRFVPDAPNYHTNTKTTKCDSQGNFTFEKIADGEFYVTTIVAWQAGNAPQGGGIMQKITVRGGQNQSIVMAP